MIKTFLSDRIHECIETQLNSGDRRDQKKKNKKKYAIDRKTKLLAFLQLLLGSS